MNKAFFLSVVAATLVLASCTKESGSKVFEAETEPVAESGKVACSDGSLLWQAGDEVSIYDGASHSAVYAVSEGAGTSHCEFAYSSGSELDEGYYTAVYPAAIRTGASTINLPATQSSADGSFAGLPLCAQSTDSKLMFYNLCGVVRFRLSASSDVSVSSIAIAADRAINGAATISGSGTSVALSTPSGTSTTTLSLGTPQSIASARDFYMYLPAGSYSTFNITVTTSNSDTYTKTDTSTISIQRGKITTIALTGLSFGSSTPTGAIDGLFTINAAGDQVYFSQGNLQFQASTGTWRFAEHQWDHVGSQSPGIGDAGGTVVGSDNIDISSSYSGWIDMFGWGTSGWSGSGAVCWQPWSTSNSVSDYYIGGAYNNNLTGSYAEADWGVHNAITGGGDTPSQWRTLTNSEWDYLLTTRADASSKAGYATVSGVHGVILLPDSFTDPMKNNGSEAFVPRATTGWESNVYTADDWTAMQDAGAVFLPAAGGRDGMMVGAVGTYGRYWSSSYSNENKACSVHFGNDNLAMGSCGRYGGRAVRLVKEFRPAE